MPAQPSVLGMESKSDVRHSSSTVPDLGHAYGPRSMGHAALRGPTAVLLWATHAWPTVGPRNLCWPLL